MKLTDIAEMTTTMPHNSTKRLVLLKGMIDNNQQPDVVEAGYHRDHFSFGDLEQIGYAKELSKRGPGGTMIVNWQYTGPNSINVNGKPMKAGDVTSPVEVDYT